MNFVEDLNGQGCLGFGGCINPNMSEGYEQGSFNIVVKEISLLMSVDEASCPICACPKTSWFVK